MKQRICSPSKLLFSRNLVQSAFHLLLMASLQTSKENVRKYDQ